MTATLTLDESIKVERPRNEVFAYVADFSRVEEWDPSIARASRLTAGAPGVGSEYQVEMKMGPTLHYQIVAFEPNSQIRMQVRGRFFTSEEEIRLRTDGGCTCLRYVAKFNFSAPLSMFKRWIPTVTGRFGQAAMAGLKLALTDEFETPRASKLLAAADRLVLPGIWRFTKLGYRCSRRRAITAYQGNRHAVITGATSGIGKATALRMAQMGAKLTLIVRNQEKAERLVVELKAASGNQRIGFEVADLSELRQVHQLSDRLLKKNQPIDILINNAGALFNPRQQTSEGFEKSFALLLLSPFVLTERLKPLLEKSRDARVVNVLSGGMYSQGIRVNDLQCQRGKYSGAVAYARAKRGLMIVTEDWAARWQQSAITVNAMHPGWADTAGVETALPEFYRLTRRVLRTPAEGADTAVWLATSTEAGRVHGMFWLDREQHPSHLSNRTKESPEARKQLLATLNNLKTSTRPGHQTDLHSAAEMA